MPPIIDDAPGDHAAMLGERKRRIRDAVRRSRRSRSDAERHEAGRAIARAGAALAERLRAHTVACFLATPIEPPTRPLIEALEIMDVRVLLPRPLDGGVLDWVVAGGGERLHALGVPEPVGMGLGGHALGEADLIFIPAAAVDGSGGRLGWGGGYYDRALEPLAAGRAAARPPVIAIVFDDDVHAPLPLEPHDARIDGVLTPSGVTRYAT